MTKYWLPIFVLSMSACVAAKSDVYYWTTDTPPPDRVTIAGHPCGTVIELKADKVPSADIPWLKADVIREIDSSGKVLRSWRVPADQYALGVEGDDLVIAHGSAPMTVLRVTPLGKLVPSSAPSSGVPEGKECPAPFQNLYCISSAPQSLHLLASPLVCT